MRRDPDFFGEEPLELVHLSRRLKEAQGVEATLTEAGTDYLLEAAPYSAKLLWIIPRERIGVYFYVRMLEAPDVRLALRGKGFTVVEVLDDED